MVDGAIRLLSLANQIAFTSRHVRLNFEEGEAGTMGYLNRMGFFDHLHPDIEVTPARPVYSAARLYRGGNSMLVEIARINKDVRDVGLPSRLTDVISRACASRPDVSELTGAAWTIFAELIDNIFAHSATLLDGYATLQVYSGGNRLSVAVSDSGLGIMQTLRPSLRTEFPRLATLSDTEVLVEVFKQGLSRHGADRGCGLKGCAAKAIKFKASLDLREKLTEALEALTPLFEPGCTRTKALKCWDKVFSTTFFANRDNTPKANAQATLLKVATVAPPASAFSFPNAPRVDDKPRGFA